VDHRTVVEAVDYDKAREVIASFVREYVAGPAPGVSWLG